MAISFGPEKLVFEQKKHIFVQRFWAETCVQKNANFTVQDEPSFKHFSSAFKHTRRFILFLTKTIVW